MIVALALNLVKFLAVLSSAAKVRDMIPILITGAAFEVFKSSYNDAETCDRFDLKRLNHAADNVHQFFIDNGIYFSACFDGRFWKLIYLFWYQVEIKKD